MLNGGVLGDCRQCEARFLREGQGPVSGPLLGSRGNDPLWSRGRSPWKYHHFSLFRGCNESKFKTLCLHWGGGRLMLQCYYLSVAPPSVGAERAKKNLRF